MASLLRTAGKALMLPVHATKMVRREGLTGTARYLWYRFGEEWREWRLGIRTTGFIPWHELGPDADCENYEAISYQCLDIALKRLDIDRRRDVLLDYGCGKGRVVVVAATYPFRRVLGIERVPELGEIARQNVDRAGNKLRCKSIEIVTADAVTYAVPHDVNVIFLFNPFVGTVLSAVQDRIRASLAECPRPLTLIYMHRAQHEDAFAKCDWIGKADELPIGSWEKVKFVMYKSHGEPIETKPAGTSS